MQKTHGNNVGSIHTRHKPKKRKAAPTPPAHHVKRDKKDDRDQKDPRFKNAKEPKQQKGNEIDKSGTNNASQPDNSKHPKNSQTFVTSETEIAMMRAKTVAFFAEGLKPKTRYYPFFDDVYVGDYCTSASNPAVDPVTGRIIDPDDTVLMSNSAGDVVGNFMLPGNTFATGTHSFRLVDAVTAVGSTFAPAPMYGSAEATYEARGVLKELQTQITEEVLEVEDPVPTPVVEPQPEPIIDPVVEPVPVRECEEWYFDYKLFSTETKYFTVSTDSATPPTTTPKPDTGGSVVEGSVVFVSTSSDPKSKKPKYNHKYSYSSANKGRTFRQSWVGHVGDTKPTIAGFRPSGIASTDTVEPLKTTWTRVGTVACPVNLGLKTPKRQDPLAQSFFIDAAHYPNGIFTTAIGVYFRNVDHSTPVILELREMANGLPSSEILPGGVCFVQGFNATSSVDATMSTVFRFDTPVFLRPSTDYCFVLKSSSMGYNAWCSRMGEIDTTTGMAIDDQPFNGTLFKSENDVTWVPDPYEDVKFDLYKADFNIATDGSLHLRPAGDYRATGVGYSLATFGTPENVYWGTGQTLPMSYISTVKGSNEVTINIPLHGLDDGKKIKIDGIVNPAPTDAYNGVSATALNGVHVVAVVDEDNIRIDLPTQDDNSHLATKTGHIQVSDIYTLFDNHPTLMPAALPKSSAIQFVDYETLSPSMIMSDATIADINSNRIDRLPPTFGSSTSFKVYTNIVVNEAMVDYMGTEFEQTSLTETIQLPAKSNYQKGSYAVEFTDNFMTFANPRLVPSLDNDATAKDLCEVTVTLHSDHKDISPVVDLNGASLMVRSYKIDNQGDEVDDILTTLEAGTYADYDAKKAAYIAALNNSTSNSEIKPGTGTAAAKYKSSINVLNEVYNKMTVFVTANCPDPAIFDVYVRTSTDKSTHMDVNWTWVPIDGIYGTAFAPSEDNTTINEWMYVVDAAAPFNVFDVKIVMRSTNSSVVPKIYGVRTIADNI